MAEAPETSRTPFMHLGGGGTGLKPPSPKNLPAFDYNLHAKFHKDLTSGFGFL